MKLKRREFIKANAAAVAASVAGAVIPIKAVAQANAGGSDVKWSKAVCRYCGVGCGVLVGVKNGRVIASQGDPEAPVNMGLNCIKGYFLPKVMYGEDRVKTPLLRMKNGQYHKEGEFKPVSWDQAFKIMAEKYKAALKNGPNAAGIFMSGQSTIWEGYAAAKLFKAGLRSNNIDPNARHCMASAVVAFMRSFGMDEPMGCYDDFEKSDAFVLWGSNMAEAHPILWSRLTNRRLSDRNVNVTVLTTFENRSCEQADSIMVFKPQTEMMILNYIAHYIIENNAVNKAFMDKHVNLKKGVTDIGYGLRANHPLEQAAKNPNDGGSTPMTFDEYKAFVAEYTLERVSKESGVPADKIVALAKLYADPKKKVMSLWCMGVNQHVRGVWTNHLIYNLHFLTGKISQPGNGPFSLTGQPSACGTAREVGTFAHRLPADMVVGNPKHREKSEALWKLPPGAIQPQLGLHAVAQDRALADGTLNAYWTQSTNNMQAGPNIYGDRYKGWRNPKNFVVVSDPYPTMSAQAADLILPTAMWVEKEGSYGNAERRGQFWRQAVKAPGEAKSDLWQLVEFSKYFKTDEVWPAEILAAAPEYKGKTLYEVLFANGQVNKFPLSDMPKGTLNDESEAFGFYLQKGLFEEYAAFGRGSFHDLGDFDRYHNSRGLRWPVVDNKETLWRYAEGYDPYVKKGEGFSFYGTADKKAVLFAFPYEPPAESPDKEYDLWFSTGRILEHWHTASMTGRVPELHRAVPTAVVYMNPEDAKKRGLSRGDAVKVQSRRGEVLTTVETSGQRNKMPPGVVHMAFFDDKRLANALTLDATDPLSKETDFKKCAVRVVKA